MEVPFHRKPQEPDTHIVATITTTKWQQELTKMELLFIWGAIKTPQQVRETFREKLNLTVPIDEIDNVFQQVQEVTDELMIREGKDLL